MSSPIIYRAAIDMDLTSGHTTATLDAPSRSFYAKASGFVASHSSGALVLIILLAIAIIFLYIRQIDWGGKGDHPHTHRRRVPHEDDLEADRLINSINSFSR